MLISYATSCGLSFENLPMTIAAMTPGPIPETRKIISRVLSVILLTILLLWKI